MEHKWVRGCPQLKFVKKIRDCKSSKTTIDFTTVYWLREGSTSLAWKDRKWCCRSETVQSCCRGSWREACCSKVFMCKDQDFSADSKRTKKKPLYTLSLPHLFTFYPSGKKYQAKGSIKLVKTRGCSSVPASSITADTAGNAILGFSWIINTFYIWHWFPTCHFCINTSAQNGRRRVKKGRDEALSGCICIWCCW